MKLFLGSLALLSPLTQAVVGGEVDNARKLMMMNFAPLSCNSEIDKAACVPWTSVPALGTATSFSSKVVIECGTCVTMDIATDAPLVFQDR